MTWQVTWSLIRGFTLSAIVQALVRKSTIARLLADDSPKSLATAAGLGAASSSCSYAAVALAPALFARAPTSPRRWHLRSRPRTWSSSSA